MAGLDEPVHRYRVFAAPPSPLLQRPYLDTPELESLLVTDARRRAVPFVECEALDIVWDWAVGHAEAPVCLLAGQGGAGKTRVAAELAWRLAAEGWGLGSCATTCGADP